VANPQNLKRLTPKKAREIGKKGGEASGKAKKEKKLMSAILADYLARQKGFDSFDQYIEKVLKRGDSSTVSMIKTFADVIEGSKLKTETTLNINTDDEAVKNILAEYGISKPKD
jgi:hypothetical protein